MGKYTPPTLVEEINYMKKSAEEWFDAEGENLKNTQKAKVTHQDAKKAVLDMFSAILRKLEV